MIRSTSISLPSARITITASATIPTCVMFISDCDFCDFCEKCEFRKSHISQFAHYLFRLLFFYIFLAQPFEYHWIASHRFIVPTLTPRTPACFTASCLVEQSFESVDEIRSPWGAFFIVPLQRIKSSQLCVYFIKKGCTRQTDTPFSYFV